MKTGYILIASLMLLYLIASFAGSGDIGILYILAIALHAGSGGKYPFIAIYDAGLALYLIIMIILFLLGGSEDE
jgi:hypothetical protein